MDRRAFCAGAGGWLAAAAVPAAARPAMQAAQPRVNGPRLLGRLEALAAFGATPEGGIRRVAYSEADLAARAFVRESMHEAGLDPRIDAAGNILARRAGAGDDLPPILMGSHIDSVPDGGNFDGQVGAMGAVEAAHALADHGIALRHPLDVVIFQNEEGGKTGSRAMSGEVLPAELDIVTASGRTIGEGIALLGGDPARLAEVRRSPGDVHGYLELHVEQGGLLERDGIDIGVVEGIVGIKRWNVTIEGAANHAGTTPMDERRDAMVAAGMLVQRVHQVARTTPGRQVATVGRIEAFPGAPNVIPGRVVASLEIRDLEMEKIDRVLDAIRAEATRLGEETGTRFTMEQFYESRAAPTDVRLRAMVEAAARELGLSSVRMPSGAGHDAQSIAQFAPVGMIFVPSAGGISHSPREFTAPEHVVAGADTLLRALLRLDAAVLD